MNRENFNDSFKVYELESFNLIAVPFVIITVCENTNYCFAETYVMFPENWNAQSPDKISLQMPKLSINKYDFLTSQRKTGIKYDYKIIVENEALERVTNELKFRITKIAREHKLPHEYWQNIKLDNKQNERILYL